MRLRGSPGGGSGPAGGVRRIFSEQRAPRIPPTAPKAAKTAAENARLRTSWGIETGPGGWLIQSCHSRGKLSMFADSRSMTRRRKARLADWKTILKIVLTAAATTPAKAPMTAPSPGVVGPGWVLRVKIDGQGGARQDPHAAQAIDPGNSR